MIIKMRDMMKRKNGQKGFTLIELIVVMAILAVLAAIAVPRYSGIQTDANKKAVVANIKTINSAAQVFAAQQNVELSAVTKANVETLMTWPTGPKTITYTIANGVSSAVVPEGGVGGIAAGTYLIDAAALQ